MGPGRVISCHPQVHKFLWQQNHKPRTRRTPNFDTDHVFLRGMFVLYAGGHGRHFSRRRRAEPGAAALDLPWIRQSCCDVKTASLTAPHRTSRRTSPMRQKTLQTRSETRRVLQFSAASSNAYRVAILTTFSKGRIGPCLFAAECAEEGWKQNALKTQNFKRFSLVLKEDFEIFGCAAASWDGDGRHRDTGDSVAMDAYPNNSCSNYHDNNNNGSFDENCTSFDNGTAWEEAVSSRAYSNTTLIVQSVIGTVGVFSNATVVIVFASHKKYRRKIPNMFIINQVSSEASRLRAKKNTCPCGHASQTLQSSPTNCG